MLIEHVHQTAYIKKEQIMSYFALGGDNSSTWLQ